MEKKENSKNKERGRFTYVVNEDLIRRAKIMAIKRGVNLNQILNELLRKEVEAFESENGDENSEKR